MWEEVHQRAKGVGISSRRVRLRLLPFQGRLVSMCLQCHFLCRHAVFTSFLWLMSLSVISELSICLRLATGWSRVVISLSHHHLVASVGICCQSRLCKHLSLLSELRIRLRLTVGLSFVAFSLSTHFLVSTCSRWF